MTRLFSGAAVVSGAPLLFFAALSACSDDPMLPPPPPPAELGNLHVTWSMMDTNGVEVSCVDLGLSNAAIAVGGTPVIVPCGETQEALFQNLPAGRYPVVISLRVLDTVPLYEYRQNGSVEGGQTSEHNAVIQVDPGSADVGTLQVRWRIDGVDAPGQCAPLNASTFRLVATEDSIAPFQIDLPCDNGFVEIEHRRRGAYVLRGSLRNSSGMVVRGLVRESGQVFVERAGTVAYAFNFSTTATVSSQLDASWTVTGSTAAEGCPGVNGRKVQVDLLNMDITNPIAIATASAACDAGSVRLSQLTTGGGYRVRFWLFDFFGATIDQKIVTMVALFGSRTTTVSADFTP